MGSVVQLKKTINNSYSDLLKSVEDKLILVNEKISSKLTSKVDLIQNMTDYHLDTGGKKLRALLTLSSSKLCGYSKGGRDINLAACVELIHAATLMHDDVIDNALVRRNKETLNTVWGNKSSILVGDYLLSRCFEMMVEDGSLEILKLLSSTSSEIAQGEVLQLQHHGEIDMLEETYLKIISLKTAALFSASTKVGAILANRDNKSKEALEFYGKNLGLTFQIADDALDYNSELKLFGKKIGNDFYEGKITLPIILLYQRCSSEEKKYLKNLFEKQNRDENEFKNTLEKIKKYKIINECYKKAEYFINLASNSLSIFEENQDKNILKNLTSFSLERNF
ncbi:polyprenyl synthetase family protein [Candidatus Pelagibacter communis]|uniref:polyprenyl synthetase family protein n=1 Tax=Pelagibacter ubique TaxID=198252 RepID=UPI000B291176|nr:polyprenyl synthetase family protein [Candidatus Pelagibacter ubique]